MRSKIRPGAFALINVRRSGITYITISLGLLPEDTLSDLYAIWTTIYTHIRIFRIITCACWGPSRGDFPQSSPQSAPTKRIEPYRYRAELLGGIGVPLAADASGRIFLEVRKIVDVCSPI